MCGGKTNSCVSSMPQMFLEICVYMCKGNTEAKKCVHGPVRSLRIMQYVISYKNEMYVFTKKRKGRVEYEVGGQLFDSFQRCSSILLTQNWKKVFHTKEIKKAQRVDLGKGKNLAGVQDIHGVAEKKSLRRYFGGRSQRVMSCL